MALSGDNCGRTFSSAEVAAEGPTSGSLYGIRAGFEYCDGTLPGGSRSYETLRCGRSSKANGDQDFDPRSDVGFVFGGQSGVRVGSLLSHLNQGETFPTGCATHSGEDIGKVFPRNFVESGDVRLGHVYDKSSGQPAFSVGSISDDMVGAQTVPGFLPGNWEPNARSTHGDGTSSEVNFPFRTTQAIKSELPSSHCKKDEIEKKKVERDDFDWSAFNVIDPLHRFSHSGGRRRSNQSEDRWVHHSTPNSGNVRIAEPFVTPREGAPTYVKGSPVNDRLHLISQDVRNTPQISTKVPHIFAQEVPSLVSANEFSAEPTLVCRPKNTFTLENDPSSHEHGDCSAGGTSETLRPVAPTNANVPVESFNRGSSNCTSRDQTSASDESSLKDGRREALFSSSSRSQSVLDRRKTQEPKLFFDPRRIFATPSKPQQKTSQSKQTINESRATTDCASGAETLKKAEETNSKKAADSAKSKDTQKRVDDKVAHKTSDNSASNTDTQKKSDEKGSIFGSKNCVLNNNKSSQAQSHSSHMLDHSHFIKNDLSSDSWKQKNADVRTDSGRSVHDRSSEQEQAPSCLREKTRVSEGVGDDQSALRKVKNATEVIGQRQDVRIDDNSSERSSYLINILKEKIFSFAVWAFHGILPIILNMLKLVIGIICHEIFSISYHLCRIAWQGLLLFCQWAKQKIFPKQAESAEDEPRTSWWQNHANQGVHRTRVSSNRFLSENITLPESGDEAIRRLFSCEGKDPYSILGLKVDCTDEEIRKYFRRQAVLVHPDKNREPGAEEAFKILNHAFELIGEPEKRQTYNAQTAFEHDEDIAMHQFNDLLTKLHEAMQESMKYMGCSCCGGKHKRVPVDRPVRAARYCMQCEMHHSAKEGDVWAESSRLGFLWRYYACMEGQIYDVTEWASCQQDELRHIPANSHQVLIHISTGRNRQQRSAARDAETELKDLLESMYGSPGGVNDMNGQCGRGGGAANDSGWKQGSASKRRKRRRR